MVLLVLGRGDARPKGLTAAALLALPKVKPHKTRFRLDGLDAEDRWSIYACFRLNDVLYPWRRLAPLTNVRAEMYASGIPLSVVGMHEGTLTYHARTWGALEYNEAGEATLTIQITMKRLGTDRRGRSTGGPTRSGGPT
jgi:hypothetical protein